MMTLPGRVVWSALAVGALWAGPHPLRAQEGDSARVADSVGVADSIPPVELSPMVVTVSRTPVRLDHVGSAVSVVTPRQMELEPPQYAFELLRDLPGAYVEEAAGPGGPGIVRIRGGEEIHTQILIDGIKANQSGGFFDMQGLWLSNLDRVEVGRGPQSAVWGSSAISGVVQFLTPAGRPGRTVLQFRGEGGDALDNGGNFLTEVRASGGNESLRFSAGGGLGFSRGVLDVPHDTWSGDASLRLDYLVSERWDLTGTFRYIRFDGMLPVRDAGATRVPLDPNARNARDRIASSAQARFSPSSRWSHEARAELFWDDFLFQDRRDDIDTSDLPFFVFNADLDFTERLWRPRLLYQGSYTSRPGDATGGLVLTYGALWEHSDVDQSVSGEFGDSELGFDRSNGAGFAELLWDVVPRASVVAGVRAEKYEGIPTEVTPKVSGVFRAVPDRLHLRGAWGEGFKAPSLSQQYQENDFIVPNPDLEPERSWSWEAGVDASPVRGLQIGLGYFHQDFENLIRTVGVEDSDRTQNRNVGRSDAAGVEWSVRWQAHRRLAVGTSGAWIQTEVLDNEGLNPEEFPEGEPLPFRPEVTGSVFADVLVARRLQAFLRWSRVGPQVVLSERFSGQRVELDGYGLVDATLTYDHSDAVSVYGRFENLLDEEYVVAYDRPGAPFRFSIGVRLSNGEPGR